MILIIQNPNIKEEPNNDTFYYLNNICNLKKIEAKMEVMILNNLTLDNNGIIKDYDFFLEEVLITKPIKTIVANFYHDKLEEICQYHQITLIYL